MTIKQKTYRVFTCSDGATFSEESTHGKDAKKAAANHEKRITLAGLRREFDVKIATMLGIKVTMDPHDEDLDEDDYHWYEDSKGPWDGGLYKLLNPLNNDSYCPGDIENAAQIVFNVQLWVKALGGLDNIKALNELKFDKDLL